MDEQKQNKTFQMYSFFQSRKMEIKRELKNGNRYGNGI